MSIIAQCTDILAPFEIWEILLDDSTIKFHQPLLLSPTYMPHDEEEPGETQYLEIVKPELNIDVYGEDRRELLSALRSEISFVWRHLVKSNNQTDPETNEIRRRYLELAEEIPNAQSL